MSSGGGGTTTVQQNGPPAQFLQAYEDVNNRARTTASAPYTPYSGNIVAPLSPDQNAGISAVRNSQGIAAPYINSAADYINRSTTPLWNSTQQFSPGAVRQYESPYTDDVVHATEAEFNNQNQQQQQGIIGDAISKGAWGGDRSAVAQGILAGQQQLAQAPVIAGLKNTGYQQALQEFNQQQGAQLGANQANAWLNSQAGFGAASLGNEAQSTSLSGANALLGIGGLEQGQAQSLLNVPYQQYTAGQAYPFQTTGWLANIAEGLGGASGGSSSTTAPGPSIASQVGGAGLAGAGILGASGAFGSNGWLTGAGGLFGSGAGGFASGAALDALSAEAAGNLAGGIGAAGSFAGAFVKDGGRIARRAPGGGIASVPDVSMSIVPGGSGFGDMPSHSGSFNLNSSTGSTSSSSGGGADGSAILGDIASIAALAIMAFSDRRLKEDISRVGTLKDGTPIHRFRFKGDPQWHIGFIADQLEHHHPEAVGRHQGYGIVDVQKATDESAQRRAWGGIVVPFPEHRTKSRGIVAANDDWEPQPQHARAGGGSLPISITMSPGNYAGSSEIPRLAVGPVAYDPSPTGIIDNPLAAGAASGIPDIANYLSSTLGTASFLPPPVATPPVTPTPDPTPPGIGGAGILENAGFNAIGGAEGGSAGGGGGSDPAGSGAEVAGGDTAGSDSDGGEGGGESEWRGGKVRRRADGGPTDEDSPGIVDNGPWGSDDTSSVSGGPGISSPSTSRASDPWNALLYAGLGILGGTSPHAGVNIGRGAEAGLKQYTQERQDAAKLAQTGSYQQGELGLRGKQIEQTGRLTQAQMDQRATLENTKLAQEKELAKLRIGLEGGRLAEERRFHDLTLDQGHYQWQPGTQADPDDPSKTVNGSWRFSTRKDEPPQFFPGVAQTTKQDASAAGFNPSGAASGDVHGDDYLKSLDPKIATQVKAIAEGRLAFPAGFALKSPYWQNMISAVSQYDPQFDAVNLNARSGTRKDFTSGQAARNVTSLNTVMGHISALKDAGEALKNGSVPIVNSAINFIKTQTGNAEVNNFQTAADAVADELEKAFRGTAGAVTGIRNWRERLNPNASPEQQAGAWKMLTDLLDSRIDSLGDQYSRGMGRTTDGLTLLSPHAQEAYSKVSGRKPQVPTYGQTGQRQQQAPAIPPEALSRLQEGHITTFQNGQRWTIQNGAPVQVP